MPRAVTNRERKERGQYCENLTREVLRTEGFEIHKSFEGGESRAEKGTVGSCPDLLIGRPGQNKEYRIEVKSGQVWELDQGKKTKPDGLLGVKPDRPGRVQLAAGGKFKGVAHKDCYALLLDDQVAKVQTLQTIRTSRNLAGVPL